MLSLPRDLAVTIPGYADNTKINQAYDEGGAGLTLKTVKHLFESATGKHVQRQRRHRRQLQRLPARGQLHQGRLRRRRPRVLQPRGHRASRRSTSSRATSGWSARTRWPTCASATPTPTSSATRASRTSCARRRACPRSTSSRASTTPATSSGEMRQYFRFDKNFLSRQEHRGHAQDRDLPRATTTRRSTRSRCEGDHRVREPDRGHAPLHLQREHRQGLRRVHDRRGRDAQPEALDQGQEGQEAGQGVAHERAGERAPAGRGHGRPGRAPAEDAAVLLPGATAPPARATRTTRRASTRSRTSRARSTARTGSRSRPARPASTTASRA